MNRLILAVILGLIVATFYFFYSDIVAGNFSKLLKIQKPNEESTDFSNLSNSIAKINWSNPIMVRYGDEKYSDNHQEITAVSDSENLIEVNKISAIGQPSQSNKTIQLDQNSEENLEVEAIKFAEATEMSANEDVDSKNESKLPNQSEFVSDHLKNNQNTEIANNNDSESEKQTDEIGLGLKVQAKISEELSDESLVVKADNLDSSEIFSQSEDLTTNSTQASTIDLVNTSDDQIDNQSPKTISEKRDITEANEAVNQTTNQADRRLSEVEESIRDLLQTYATLNQEIEQISQISLNEANLNQNNSSSTSNLEKPPIIEDTQSSRSNELDPLPENNINNDLDIENIDAVIKTIISTRKLLESLSVGKEDQSNQNNSISPSNQSMIKEESSLLSVPADQKKGENIDESEKVKSDINGVNEELNNIKNNERLLSESQKEKANQQIIREFSKGMLSYAIELDKSGEDQKALKILLQIESQLSDDLNYLRTMVEMQKKNGDTQLILYYLNKAVQQSVVDGDYGAFQEIIGETMQIDILIAGDMIQRYASRFDFANSN